MENALQIYNSEEFGKIRALTIDGNPYFVGKDVAEALGYEKPRNALQRHVDEDDALKRGVTDSLGRTQVTTLINESGLYSLILSSKLPTAKKFKRWVTSEVLPSIRKTGAYVVDKAYQKWLASRQHGTLSRKEETSVIKVFIDYARGQGCTWSKKFFYSTITVQCNVGAGLPIRNGRDSADIQQLNTLDLLEGTVVKNILLKGMDAGLHYAQIWAKVQLQIKTFLEVTFQNPELLT